MDNLKNKIISILLIFGFVVFLGFAGFSGRVFSQTANQVILTWRAESFAPPDFQGRTLPSPGSMITVSAEEVSGGRILDLSRTSLSWDIDGRFFQDGTGLKKISFKADTTPGSSHFVRVAIERSGGKEEATAQIPVSSPTVAIAAPYYPAGTAPRGGFKVFAEPYFFNVGSIGDLLFFWDVNGAARSGGSDNSLEVSADPLRNERYFRIKSIVQNRKNILEVGREGVVFTAR